MVPEKISADTAFSEYGIIASHEKMPNGELRFRLMGSDGNGYIRTVIGPVGAWQNSHYHKRISETYVVETGWIVIATDKNLSELMLYRLGSGDSYTTTPLEQHNVYMSPATVIHTVKHKSARDEKDWYPATDFDNKCKHLSEEDILAQCVRR